MILSFHPCYEADVNRLCAGREPNEDDRSAMQAAAAVILPQGCRESLYRLARQHCRNVFPNYDQRFRYPGKTGQARLFKTLKVPHPQTWIFDDTNHFRLCGAAAVAAGFPLVFKLDWGGEGETVFLLRDKTDLDRAVATAAAYERTGQPGFIIQAYVANTDRTLRVVVIDRTVRSYWRIQDRPSAFGTSVSKGARLDTRAEPDRRRMAVKGVRRFCRRTGIDLAGFDLIVPTADHRGRHAKRLFLEINYFFGRSGLGGSDRYYALLEAAIDRWLHDRGLARGRGA